MEGLLLRFLYRLHFQASPLISFHLIKITESTIVLLKIGMQQYAAAEFFYALLTVARTYLKESAIYYFQPYRCNEKKVDLFALF